MNCERQCRSPPTFNIQIFQNFRYLKQSYLLKSIINSQLIYINLNLESISYFLNERFAYGGSKHFLTEIDPYE